MKQHLKSYVELIVLFVNLIKNTFGYSSLGVEKKLFPSKITFVPTQNHLYFIILCYKGRKNTIVPAVSQFTRYSLSVLSLSKGKAKIKNKGYFFRVWLAANLVAGKPAFLHHF